MNLAQRLLSAAIAVGILGLGFGDTELIVWRAVGWGIGLVFTWILFDVVVTRVAPSAGMERGAFGGIIQGAIVGALGEALYALIPYSGYSNPVIGSLAGAAGGGVSGAVVSGLWPVIARSHTGSQPEHRPKVEPLNPGLVSAAIGLLLATLLVTALVYNNLQYDETYLWDTGAIGLKLTLVIIICIMGLGFGIAEFRQKGNRQFLAVLGIIFSLSTVAIVYQYSMYTQAYSIRSGYHRVLRQNMDAIQKGVEQYRGDHAGNFPACLGPVHFDWSTYVPLLHKNPLNNAMSGPQLLDSCMVSNNPIESAMKDQRAFIMPGTIRYYTNRDRSHYAISTSDAQRKPLKETEDPSSAVYVLHD